MAYVGNTIKLTCNFVTWAGSKSDAENIRLEVYDGTKIIQTINLDESNHVSTGVYSIYYVIPSGNTNLLFRFVGTVEGYPEVGFHEEDRKFSSYQK